MRCHHNSNDCWNYWYSIQISYQQNASRQEQQQSNSQIKINTATSPMADAKSRKAFENKCDIKRWWINLLHAGYWALECLRIGTLAASPFCFFSWNLNTVHAFILTRCAKNSVHTSISKSRIVSSLWPELQPEGNFFWPRHFAEQMPRSEKVSRGLQFGPQGRNNPTFWDGGMNAIFRATG